QSNACQAPASDTYVAESPVRLVTTRASATFPPSRLVLARYAIRVPSGDHANPSPVRIAASSNGSEPSALATTKTPRGGWPVRYASFAPSGDHSGKVARSLVCSSGAVEPSSPIPSETRSKKLKGRPGWLTEPVMSASVPDGE